MRLVRENVFETNSSSSHSVVITGSRKWVDRDDVITPDEDGYIHVSLGEYGMSFEEYTSPYDKLSYVILLIMYQCNVYPVYEESDFDLVRSQLENCSLYYNFNERIAKYTDSKGLYIDNFDGYIDHQSVMPIHEFLDEAGLDSIFDFIFCSKVKLVTDSD